MARKDSSKAPLSRADQIRQRRKQQEQQHQLKPALAGTERKSPSTKQNISPAHQPQNLRNASAARNPVILTRHTFGKAPTKKSRINGAISSRPLLERARTKVRRKFVIPLNTPGGEINLPALPQVKIGWRLISGAIVVLCLFSIILFTTSPFFKVNHIEIEGLERVNPGDVKTVLNLSNTPIYEIVPQQVKAVLQRDFPDLLDISIMVMIPNGVSIRASERKPMVSWQYNDQLWFIDEEGIVFPSRGYTAEDTLFIKSNEMPPSPAPNPVVEGFTLPWFMQLFSSYAASPVEVEPAAGDMPKTIVEGMELSHKADLDLIYAAQALSTQVPEDTVLIYSSRDGLGWFDNRGWNVFIGLNLENMNIKISEYLATVQQLQEKGIQPTMISVEHIHAPFYRVD
jgi:hypothetical protein